MHKVNSLVVIGSFLFQYAMRACPDYGERKKRWLGQVICAPILSYYPNGGFEKSEPPFLAYT